MSRNTSALSGAAAEASESAGPAVDPTALDKSIEALKTYDYGANRAALVPIDDAVVAGLGDPAAAKELEKRLAALLKSNASPVAKDYVCRKLHLIGSAESVPALAELLADKDLSHPARQALEHIPDPAAARALRESLPKLGDPQKAGVIDSLGMRRDEDSVKTLTAFLKDPDTRIAGAAAAALGNIATTRAARALRRFQPKAPDAVRPAVADACLACAERLLIEGRKRTARALYEALCNSEQPEHVQLAAKRGISIASGKK